MAIADYGVWAQLIATLGLLLAIGKMFGRLLLAVGKIVQRLDDHENTDDERHDAQNARIARIEAILMSSK